MAAGAIVSRDWNVTEPARRLARLSARRKLCSSQRGISLYDAIVTLAIVGITATIGIPSLQAILANTRLTTATNTLIAALYTTRSEAITRGQRVVLCPSSDYRFCTDARDWHVGYVLYVDQDGSNSLDPGEPVVRAFDALAGVTVRSSSGRDHVTYRPSGLASGSNLSFSVCARGATAGRAVIVSNSGRARVAARLPDGTHPCPVR